MMMVKVVVMCKLVVVVVVIPIEQIKVLPIAVLTPLRTEPRADAHAALVRDDARGGGV